MTIRANFGPHYGAASLITTSTSSGTTSIGRGAKSLMLVNTDGSNSVYIRTSEGTSTATTADLLVRPGATLFISKPQDHDTVAHIAAAGTPVLYVMPGEGGS